MPRFSFQVLRGPSFYFPNFESDLHDDAAAFRAGADICANLVEEIIHSLSGEVGGFAGRRLPEPAKFPMTSSIEQAQLSA